MDNGVPFVLNAPNTLLGQVYLKFTTFHEENRGSAS